jgi:hypothetical protein
MICARFGLRFDDSAIHGPEPCYLLSGDVLYAGPDRRVVAVYRDGTWEYRGHRFVRFEFTERGLILIDFEGAPAEWMGRFGPFDQILVADGVLFADDKPFAKFREDCLSWYVFEVRTILLSITIEAAGSSSVSS